MKLNTKNAVILIFLLAAIGYLLYYFQTRVPFDQRKPAVRESAPAIALSDLGGNMVALSDFRGKVVLVNFWASWCPPCKAEMPGFQKVFLDLEEKGFIVLAIALDDIPLSLVRELGVSFPVMKINDRVKREYGEVSDVPQSFLIDREGKIIRKVWKVYSENDLRSDVERALGVRQ